MYIYMYMVRYMVFVCVNVNVNVNVTPVSHAIDFCPLSNLIKSLSKSIKTSK